MNKQIKELLKLYDKAEHSLLRYYYAEKIINALKEKK